LAETAGICSDLLLWHQRGIGSESLSAFFGCCISKSGCSASALRETGSSKNKSSPMAQAQGHGEQIGMEVVMKPALLILVAMELASGFIFSEVECEKPPKHGGRR